MTQGKRSGFELSDSRLDMGKLKRDLENPQAGALVTFEGWVRNHQDGRDVERLDYEAFDALAEKEGLQIIQEAVEKFDIWDAYCVHRTGRLVIGEAAVWVGVTSSHRDAAFQAARYVIDAIKTRLPIWKKEHYRDGEATWVNCQQCAHAGHSVEIKVDGQVESPKPDLTRAPIVNEEPEAQKTPDKTNLEVLPQPTLTPATYYQRQIVLPEIGVNGQQKLASAKVLVVGAGGLGSSALLYLAGAGIGTLGICDIDRLDGSNLQRQVLYRAEDIGKNKTLLAAERLQALNPFITLRVHPKKLEAHNIRNLFMEYDLILDCTDNFQTRFLMNDAAVSLNKPLIQASIYQYEGQIHLYHPQHGSCLRCQWTHAPQDGLLGNCMESGVIGAVAGMFGSLQAMEAIKLLVGLPTPLAEHMMMVDLLTYQTRLIRRQPSPDCPVCRTVVHLHVEATTEQAPSVPAVTTVSMSNVTPLTVPNAAHTDEAEDETGDYDWELFFDDRYEDRLSNYILVDVGEAREHVSLPGHPCLNMPFSRFDLDNPLLDHEQAYLLYCYKGVRSAHLARELRRRGYKNVYALAGGLVRQQLHERRADYVRG